MRRWFYHMHPGAQMAVLLLTDILIAAIVSVIVVLVMT